MDISGNLSRYKEKLIPAGSKAERNLNKIKKKMKYETTSVLYRVFRYVFLISISFIVFRPIFIMLMRSLALEDDVMTLSFVWLPLNYTFTNFQKLIVLYPHFVPLFKYTGIITLGSTALSLVTCSITGYGLSRYKFKGSGIVFMLAIITYIFPLYMASLPRYVQFHGFDFLGLGQLARIFNNGQPLTINVIDSYWVYFIPAAFGVGINSGLMIYLFYAFFKAMPAELEEAARVDGAGEWRALLHIVLPMSRSAIITVALFSFLNGWGDFIFALTLLSGTEIAPTTLSLYDYIGQFSGNWGAVMAVSVFAIAPAAIMLIAAQRYISAGLTAGSVKG